MSSQLRVAVVTPARQVFEASVDSIVAPSVLGQLTVLPQHAPLLADLGPGLVELRRAGAMAERYFISGGFLEVEDDRVVVLCESAESVGLIDSAQAQRQLQEAETQLTRLEPSATEFAEVQRLAEVARRRVDAVRPG